MFRIILAWVFVSSLMAAPSLVNGIAATLGKANLTVQDAQVFRSVLRFLDGTKPTVLLEEGAELKQTVQKLVFEEMVYAESQGFEFEGGSDAQANQALQKAKARPNGLEEWKSILKRFFLTEAEAVAIVKKHFRADRFLQKKVETLTPIVTESEIQRYFRQNATQFSGKKLGQVRGEIVAGVKKDRTEKGLQDWMRYLTDKYQATIHLN